MPRKQVAQPRLKPAYEREVIPEDEFLALEAALQRAERIHEAQKLGSAPDLQCPPLGASTSSNPQETLRPCTTLEAQRDDSRAGARVSDIEDLASRGMPPPFDAVFILADSTVSAVGPSGIAMPQWRAMLGERPLDRRKSRGLSVTDLTSSEWCEQRMSFVLTLGKPPPTEAMQSGSERHQALEAEVVEVVEVEVQTREDVWALRFLNSVARMQQLWHDGLTRELLVVARMGGVWLVGIIDEIRLRPYSLCTASPTMVPTAPHAQPSQQDSSFSSGASMHASAELPSNSEWARNTGQSAVEPSLVITGAAVESLIPEEVNLGGSNECPPRDPLRHNQEAHSQVVPMDISENTIAAEGHGSGNDSTARKAALGQGAVRPGDAAQHARDAHEGVTAAPEQRKAQGKFPVKHEAGMQKFGADAPLQSALSSGEETNAPEQAVLVPLDAYLWSPDGSEEGLPRSALGMSRQLLGAAGSAGPTGGVQWRALLVDTKTRWRPRPPREAQSRNSRLQLMLYKKMFDSLLAAGLPSADFCSAFFLDPNSALSPEVVAYAATLLPDRPRYSLADVIKLFNYTARMMPPSYDSLLLRYEWQADGSLLGEDLFEHEEAWAEDMLQHHLQFWRGERMPDGVAERDGWKCDFCKFAQVCPTFASRAGRKPGHSPEPRHGAPS